MNDDVLLWCCSPTMGQKCGYYEAHEGDGCYPERPNVVFKSVLPNLAFAIMASASTSGVCVKKNGRLTVRYLTERECLRLMGQSDDAIDKLKAAEPSSAIQYRLAGNSIVVDCLEAIFKGIYFDKSFEKSSPKQTSLEVFA